MTPYQQGRQDYCNDIPLQDNPYTSGSQDAADWHDGWRDCNAEDYYDEFEDDD